MISNRRYKPNKTITHRTCDKCIHLRKNNNCDLQLTSSTTVKQRCKYFCKNDYVFTEQEKEEHKQYQNKQEKITVERTDYEKRQIQLALKKKKLYQ